jgi:HSP20 family protein
MRWEPLHELVMWHSRAQRLRAAESSGWAPAVDLYETDEAFCIAIELAGFRPGEFDVQATADTVTITGQRGAPDSSSAGSSGGYFTGGGQFLHVERGQGAFTRRFKFPQPIAVGDISATFRDGLLAVRVRKLPTPAPQAVPITG